MMKLDLAPARRPRPTFEDYRWASMRNQQDHAQLMNDIIEEVWKHNDHWEFEQFFISYCNVLTFNEMKFFFPIFVVF